MLSAFYEYIEENGQVPNQTQLKNICAVHSRTIDNHWNTVIVPEISRYVDKEMQRIKGMIPFVFEALIKAIKKGDVKAMSTFMQYVVGKQSFVDITSMGEKIQTGHMTPVILGTPLNKIKKEQEN